MWIIYRKKDLSIVGLSADCDPDLEREVALTQIVKGSAKPEPMSHYDAVQVTDRAQARAFMNAYPTELALRQKPGGEVQLAIEPRKQFALLLSCDATDVHPVDGIPEIAAGGESFTTIQVQKVDEQGKPQTGKTDNDQLFLRTDYGTLFSADGEEEINSLKLKKGEAAFRLVSEDKRRVATVQVFNADNSLLNTTINIEFI
ncbi:MAG TPA: hypothetical protein VJ302_00590 [Blastocatellia bacterium]|nr:hypothetical protein [Blastocatellia bacterium]